MFARASYIGDMRFAEDTWLCADIFDSGQSPRIMWTSSMKIFLARLPPSLLYTFYHGKSSEYMFVYMQSARWLFGNFPRIYPEGFFKISSEGYSFYN